MKLLLTVQPKNGGTPSGPMLIDTDKCDLCRLADDFLRAGDNVLVFQPVTEYYTAFCGDCDKKNNFSFFSSDIAYHLQIVKTAPSVIVLKIVNIVCACSLRNARAKLIIFDTMLIGAFCAIYLPLRFRKIKGKSILYLRGSVNYEQLCCVC